MNAEDVNSDDDDGDDGEADDYDEQSVFCIDGDDIWGW